MPTFRRPLLWTSLLLFSAQTAQAAPPCDPTVEPTQDRSGYKSRDANRCEGMYVAKVSSPAGRLDLVALTRGPLKFDPAAEPVVKLMAGADEPLRVRGVGIPEKTYYRLDALIPKGGTLEWKLSDVVGPVGLRPDQLGLAAFQEGDPPLYLPLGRDGSGPVTLLALPSSPATELYWRSAARKEGRCGPMGKWNTVAPPGGMGPGAPGRIELPANTKGDICLEAQATPRQGSGNLHGLWHIRTGS